MQSARGSQERSRLKTGSQASREYTQCSIFTALTFNWRATVKNTNNREFLYYITGEKSSERKEEKKKRGKERKKKSQIERQNGGRIKLYWVVCVVLIGSLLHL